MVNLIRGRRWRVLLALAVVVVAGSSVAALAATTKSVKVENSSFSVKRLTIRKGGRVTWNWVGFLNHNVTVKKGPTKFHSRTQARGSYTHRFNRKGVYHLYCTLHPYMKMTV